LDLVEGKDGMRRAFLGEVCEQVVPEAFHLHLSIHQIDVVYLGRDAVVEANRLEIGLIQNVVFVRGLPSFDYG